MPARVILDAYPSTTYTGRVTEISAVAQESARASMRRAFRVIVTLDKIEPGRMRPGTSAKERVGTHAPGPVRASHVPPRRAAERDVDLARRDRRPQRPQARPLQQPGMRGAAMIRLRYLIPIAVAVLLIGGAWTFRNQLAADRQGEWVNVSRGDLATGV